MNDRYVESAVGIPCFSLRMQLIDSCLLRELIIFDEKFVTNKLNSLQLNSGFINVFPQQYGSYQSNALNQQLNTQNQQTRSSAWPQIKSFFGL